MNNLEKKSNKNMDYKEKILQVGEGNFLRAFATWMVSEMNDKVNYGAKIVVIAPRKSRKVYSLDEQDGKYTLIMKGLKNGKPVRDKKIIDSISRAFNTYEDYELFINYSKNPDLEIIISNTTEAGIYYENQDKLGDKPQKSFPGKMTAFLYSRFKYFDGAEDKGVIFLPCELIEKNGTRLKEIILKLSKDWNLEDQFIDWLINCNTFCNTLVDRIVSGFPDNYEEIFNELGYKDEFLVESELYYLWVIEGNDEINNVFPVLDSNLNVKFTKDLKPYRERKVRILNGAHTSMVPVGYLSGMKTVGETMDNNILGNFIKNIIFKEILPAFSEKEDDYKFAEDVIERFKNPFLEHKLIDISLNSISKFRTRLLPSILDYYEKFDKIPEGIVLSFSFLIKFYEGKLNGEKIHISDNEEYIEILNEFWSEYNKAEDKDKVVEELLSNEKLWSINLNDLNNFRKSVVNNLEVINEKPGLDVVGAFNGK